MGRFIRGMTVVDETIGGACGGDSLARWAKQAGGRVDALKNHFFHCYPFGCRRLLARQQRDEKVPGAVRGPFTRHSSSLCWENEPISISDWRDNVLNRRACRVTMRQNKRGRPLDCLCVGRTLCYSRAAAGGADVMKALQKCAS